MEEKMMGQDNLNQVLEVATRAFLDNTRDMVFIKSEELKYIAVSKPFIEMVGKNSPEEIIGKKDTDIFEDEVLAKRYIADDKKMLKEGNNLLDYIEPITDEKGKHRYGSTSKYLLRSKEGEVIGILGITKDITKSYLARQNFQKELKYLFELPKEVYAVTYIDIDSWRIISQRKQMIGNGTLQTCQTMEELAQAAAESIKDKDCDAAKFYRAFSQEFLHNIFESGRTHMVFKYERELSNGETHWLQNDVRFMTDLDSGHVCAMLSARNIDTEKRAEEKLVLAARMDRMTMVLNRDTTMEYIHQIFLQDTRCQHALFMIDIDNFKALNDTHGHVAGDEFLILFAAELKSNFRDSDIVGRVGGDEFFALMKNVQDKEMVEKKAKDLLKAIQKVCVGYEDVELSGSIGIAMYPQDGKSLEALYKRADSALYKAKREGKSTYIFSK